MAEPTGPHGHRDGPEEHRMQGHWLLATLGKRVLRPGGMGLTRQLLGQAAPGTDDRIIEFGPGIGSTATMLLARKPYSYIGVDPNPEGRQALARVLAHHRQARLVEATAAATGLPGNAADLIVGEAILSMHSQDDKAAIVSEAVRLLAPGGRYAIHELLRVGEPDELSGRDHVTTDISRTIMVGARPLTTAGWEELLTSHGLEICWRGYAPMRLLEPTRIVADEGLFGAWRFARNLLRNRPARQRVLAMRAAFREHTDDLGAIAIVARRPR